MLRERGASELFFKCMKEHMTDDAYRTYFKRMRPSDYVRLAFSWGSARAYSAQSLEESIQFWADISRAWRECIKQNINE